MKNVEIAKVFQDMADLLELKEENKFKIRAYRRAAQAIEHLPQEMAAMPAQGDNFHAIPGIGDAIAKKSTELIQTGKLKVFEDLKADAFRYRHGRPGLVRSKTHPQLPVP